MVERLHEIAPTEPLRRGDQLNRLDQLITETRAITRRTARQIDSTIKATGIELARQDIRYTTDVLATELARDIAVTPLPGRVLRRVADRAIIEGAPTATWWSRQADQLQRAFEDRVRRGLMQGSAPQEIMRAIKGTAKRGFKDGIMTEQRKGQVEALVRSSLMAVNNSIAVEESQQHDFVKGYQWMVTFDSKTCPTCQALSGGAFDFEGNPLEHSKVQIKAPTPYPPAHVNCLPADALVSTIGRVAAHSKRRYQGDLIILRAAGDLRLACTPNHPVLTDAGWLPAHRVDE